MILIHLNNAALLLIDHQVGLMQLPHDMFTREFRNNILGLAKTAKLFELPVILTTSVGWVLMVQSFQSLRIYFQILKL